MLVTLWSSSRENQSEKTIENKQILILKNYNVSDIKKNFPQRVRFWNEKNESIFELKKIKRVRFWIKHFTLC